MKHAPTTLQTQRLLAHTDWLRGLAQRLVADEQAAEDLVQSTLLAAVEHSPEDRGGLRGWMRRTLRNFALQGHRSETRRRHRERSAADPEAVASVAHVVIRAELHQQVVAAVLAQDEPYRSTLLLRFYDELSPLEIARTQQVPVATVYSRLQRGLERVRSRLDGDLGGRGAWKRMLVPWMVPANAPHTGGASASMTKAGAMALIGGFALMSTPMKFGAALVLLVASVATWLFVHSDEAATHPPDAPAPSAVGRTGPAETTPDPPADLDPVEAERLTVAVDAPPSSPPPDTPSGGVLQGTVRDRSGAPVPGAWVVLGDPQVRAFSTPEAFFFDFLSGFDPASIQRGGEGWEGTTSDAEGGFEFGDVGAAERWTLGAVHPREGSAVLMGIPIREDASPVRRDIPLEGGVVLHGRVSDESGAPITGASLNVSASQTEFGKFVWVNGGSIMRSDEDGNYRFHPLPFRYVSLHVSARGFHGADTGVLEIPPGTREHRLDFSLIRSSVLEGTLIAGTGGPARMRSIFSSRDEDPDGAYPLRTRLAAHTSREDPRLEGRRGMLRLDRGFVDLERDRYEVRSGQPGARFVSVWFEEVLLGAAEIPQPGVGPEVVLDLDSEALTAVLEAMQKEAALLVRVIDGRSGAAPPTFKVQVLPDPRWASPGPLREAERKEEDLDPVRFDGLLPGDYMVWVEAPGYSPASDPVQILPDVPEQSVVVRMERGQASIAGEVVDPQRSPLNQVTVLLYRPDGSVALPFPHFTTKTNVEGSFRFTGLIPGDYWIVAQGEGLAPVARSASARPTADSVRLILDPGITVSLLPEVDGAPSPGRHSFRVLTEAGIPVVDHLRMDLFSTGSGSRAFVLAPGRYVAEVYSTEKEHWRGTPWARTGRREFQAAEGARVTVPLLSTGQ